MNTTNEFWAHLYAFLLVILIFFLHIQIRQDFQRMKKDNLAYKKEFVEVVNKLYTNQKTLKQEIDKLRE